MKTKRVGVILLVCVSAVIAIVYVKFFSEKKLFAPSSVHIEDVGYSSAKRLNGKIVFADSSNCITLCVAGHYLLLARDNNDAAICVYDTDKEQIVSSFGRTGNARNELLNVPLEFYCEEGHDGRINLYLTDYATRTTKVADLEESMKSGNYAMRETIKHKLETYEYRAFGMSGGKCVYLAGIGYVDPRDENFFPPYVLFADGKSRTRFDLYPRLCKNKYKVYNYFYWTFARYNSQNGKIVEGFGTIDMFNIIDVKKQTIDNYRQKGSYGFEEVENLQSLSAAKKMANVYYVDVAFSKDCFFMLYDGRSFSEQSKSEGGCYIKKYDWNGNLKAIYRITERLKRIAFDEKHSQIFGLDVENRVFKYDMKTGL